MTIVPTGSTIVELTPRRTRIGIENPQDARSTRADLLRHREIPV
jgi:hypothetical protein